MKHGIILACLLLTVGQAIASNCPASDNESVLQPFYEYWYHFRSEAVAEAVGTTNDRSRMVIECEVHIAHSHECFYILKLKNCLISAVGGPPESETPLMDDKKKLTDLSRFPIMFMLVNGEIKQLYTDANDPIFFVNIKRGALSAFVLKKSSTSQQIDELHTDVHGTCPWHSVPVDGTSGFVKGSKDMGHCAFPSRPDWQFSPWSIFWNMSFIQYQINSTFHCDYKIDVGNQRLEKMNCKERHAIGLESTHRTTTAVQTNIFYDMTFEKALKLKDEHKHSLLTRQSDIIFEYEQTPDPSPENEPQNFMAEAERKLLTLVEISQEEIRLFTISEFNNFVAWLRTSHNLLPFVQRVKNCQFLGGDLICTDNIKELALSYMSDALVQCNTLPCYQAISELVLTKSLSTAYLNFVLYSWSNMHFTKPDILKYVKEICDAQNSRFCWLVLGTMVQNYQQSSYNENSGELKEVTDYFYNHIALYCDDEGNELINQLNERKYEQLSMYLRAVGNIGAAYSTYSPGGIRQLLRCITKETLPISIRITSLEVLHKLNACQLNSTCNVVYDVLSRMLLNFSLDVKLRLEAYRQLILAPEVGNFKQDIIDLLQTSHSQILSYIASDLSLLLNDAKYRREHNVFTNELEISLQEKGIDLIALQNWKEEKSHSTSYGHFFRVPYLPALIQEFGFKIDSSVIYPFYNIIPQLYRTNTTLQLFGKVLNLFQVGGYIEGIDKFQPLIQKLFKELHGRPLSSDLFSRAFLAIEQFSQQIPVSEENYPFDTQIVDNIKKIHNLFQKYKPSAKSSFNFYIDLLGRTMNMLTSEDLPNFKTLKDYIPSLIETLKDGIVYNNTRVIRVIEAYHQIPTIMGLPLNWTTNATLAFSSRKGINLTFNKENSGVKLQGSGFFQPSMALTFLNRMVLDFPTFTQIGVQANSSGYSSTQLKAHFNYDDANNKREFLLEAPQKAQKILELFRTNQLIKHNTYEDISDWDIQRTSVSWCSSEKISSALGLEVCHDRSYPRVTNLIKPWALMAGWCKWTLEVRPFDKDLKFYSLKLEKNYNEQKKETKFVFVAPGSTYKREIIMKLDEKLDRSAMTASIQIEELPHFGVMLSHVNLSETNKISDRMVLDMSLTSDLKYKMNFVSDILIPKNQEGIRIENKSPKSKKVGTIMQEKSLNLITPHNIYEYVRKTHLHGKDIKADVLISYKNLNAQFNWLSPILPPVLWDQDTNAWVKLRFSMKGISPKVVHVDIDTPKSAIQLVSKFLTMPGRTQLLTNLTKVDASKNVLGFVNFTYNLWHSAKDTLNANEIRIFNLTIPRKSWSLQTETRVENGKTLYDVILSQAHMEAKDEKDVKHIGWWSNEMSDRFDLRMKKLKFKADIDSKMLESSELLKKVPSLKEEEEELMNLKNQYKMANIEFIYPSSYRDESIRFDGYFITSGSSAVFRYQKDFSLVSSYHNLRLDSHSIYKSGSNNRYLSHHSYFTHIGSETKAFYNLNYKEEHNENGCLNIDFNHNISSHVLDFTSNISYHCDIVDPGVRVLTLNLDSNSSYWDKLNSRIRQKIESNRELGFETMNFTHPLMNIAVTAQWRTNQHFKKAIFTRTLDNSPMMILNLEKTFLKNASLVIDILNDGKIEKQIIYHRKLINDFKHVTIDLFFPNKHDQVLKLDGKIVNPHQRNWILEIYPKATKLFMLFKDIGNQIADSTFSIAKNEDHPVNQILKPALKMPISEYLSLLKHEVHVSAYNVWNASAEILAVLKPIYETPIYIINHAVHAGMSQVQKVYSAVEKKSITIWAIKYFKLPELFQQGLTNLPTSIDLLSGLFMKSSDIMKLTFQTHTMFSYKSFAEWPAFTFPSYFKKQDHLTIKPHYHRFMKSKIAMIFGSSHVYTFDGKLYEFSKYPSEDCIFLLAHDVYGSRFSVLSSENSIHLLFPEISVTIDSYGQVFINGSATQYSLPLQSMNRNIGVRKEGDIIKVSSPFIVVLCEIKNQLCTFELSSWNGGRTIGLLGNADGETFNEYTLPDGSTTDDLLEFAVQYELSEKPKCKRLNYPNEPVPTTEQRSRCEKQLEKVCRSLSDRQERFMEPCIIDLQESDQACYSVAALSALCYFENEQMQTKCNVKQQEKQQIRHKLEIILVMNEHVSMIKDGQGIFVKGIDSILNALEQQFQSNGYSNIQYSLIGFGGTGVHFHPSVHTVDNNIWVSHKTAVNRLLKTLDFKGSMREDPITALRYAIEVLGHDTFDSKIIIIFTDTDQQVSKRSTLRLVQSYLDKNLVTLYTFASYPTIEKGKKVYGVRADGLMFPSPSKSSEAFLEFPRGDLAKLTSATKGSLFLKKFVDSNGPQSFFTEFAQEVWAKVRKEVQFCRKCKTVQNGWWSFFNKCHLSDCNS